ncbi:MAG: hypothetical protein HZA14_11690 [Nitrospirae bacterium]|nr:hypothetical protein [Nitrospirota bacterium]
MKKMTKNGKNIIRMVEKYAEEKKGNYKAIKESMQVYEDYLKQKGVDVNKKKIISAEGYNVYNYM